MTTNRIIASGALVLLTAASAAAQAQGQSSNPVRIELYPDADPHVNPVVLTFTGQQFGKGVSIPAQPSGGVKLPDDVAFLSALFAADVSGSLEDILKLWDAPDRDAIRGAASDPKAFEANRNFYRGITSSSLLATMQYGPYEILFVKHTLSQTNTSMVKDYPLIRRNGSLLLTNALQRDPLFVYVSTKYAQTLQQQTAESK